MTVKTAISADSAQLVRVLLNKLYGLSNVVAVRAVPVSMEGNGPVTKPADSTVQQVRALTDLARRIAQQKKQLQASQAMNGAQERMRDAAKL